MSDDRREIQFRESSFSAASPGNEQLRRRFAGLRQEDERDTPQFAALWRRRQRKTQHGSRWLMAGACAVIAVVGLLWLWAVRSRPEGPMVASITAWRAPTDFLLETPGRELLRTVPKIGAWSAFTLTPHQEATPSPAGKKVVHLHHGGLK
jgi:hypothetical protein